MSALVLMTSASLGEAPAKPSAANLWVPLTLTERAGVERFNEPVTGGVPLPENLIEDVSRLVLLGPDGRPVPTQFTVLSRWNPGPSIRWALLDFQASLPANASATYMLTDTGGNPAPKHAVTVERDGNVVTLDTGKLKLTVLEKGFNLFDEAWIDESGEGRYGDDTRLVKSHGGGPVLMHSGAVLPDFKQFRPSNDPEISLTIEEAGPLRAVVRIEGKHISADSMPGDNRLLDFVCRIHAHAGSGLVRVVYSMMNRQGATLGDGVPLDRAWLALPLVLDRDTRTWAAGLPHGAAVHPGTDVEREMPAWRPEDLNNLPGPDILKFHQAGLADLTIHADRSDRIRYDGDFFRKRLPIVGGGKRDKEGCLTAGWLDLADAQKGVAVGIKWFWQTWPRAVKADPSAVIVMLHANMDSRPPLMTRPSGPRAHWYPGMSQTSETMFFFHGPRRLPEIVGAYAGLNRPLRPLAAPSWYCEETRVWGRLASSDPALYDEDTRALVQAYDQRLREALDAILRARDYDWGDYDSYGMFNFGDVLHHISGNRSNPSDRNVSWCNNYYDYARALLLQFARTGDEEFLETGIEAQHHLMDMDMMCWHPTESMIGCNRYCDGGMHIRMGTGGGIYASPSFNHYKAQSHFDRYWLTGDRRALEMGLLSAEFAMKNDGLGWGEPRSLGHGPLGLLAAWQATGDRRYLDRATEFQRRIARRALAENNPARIRKGRHWQGGIAFEGLREFHEQTGCPDALASLKVLTEHCFEVRDWAPSTLHAFAFLGAQLDNEDYRRRARQGMETVGRGIANRSWGFGQAFGNTLRNAPYVFWYLSPNLPQKLEPRMGTPHE